MSHTSSRKNKEALSPFYHKNQKYFYDKVDLRLYEKGACRFMKKDFIKCIFL